MGKHAGGRPSKYKPEYCEKIVEFFTYEPQREVKIPHYQKGEVAWEDIKLLPTPPKFLIDFALQIGVNRDTLNEWVSKHPKFSEAFKKAKELNEMTQARGVYMGVYNPTGFIFTMKNIAGWRDKRDIEHSGGLNFSKIVVEIKNGSKE